LREKKEGEKGREEAWVEERLPVLRLVRRWAPLLRR